ncbi:MAG: AAA family ATPase [Clostridiales bacterium]|nr:AAA family ATPase [Clostridiales bacterium]
MNKFLIDICQTGNFSIDEKVNLDQIKKLRKKGGALFAVVDGKEYKLNSLDDESDFVVRNFSDFPDEENESIYECNVVNNHLVVLLYVFSRVRRIDLESETMHFYLERMVKNQFEELGEIVGGDEIKFLQDEFMNNKSVFIAEYQGGSAIRTFQMYGNRYRANVEKERPGIYRIKKLTKIRVNNSIDRIIQIYGHVKFVTFDEAIKTKGHDAPLAEVHTNELFKAWQEFISFESKVFHDEVVELGYAKYKSYRNEGEEIVLQFEKNVDSFPLFGDRVKASSQEYDIVFSETGNSFKNIEEIIEQREKTRGATIRLGKALNESFDTNELIFNYPEIAVAIPEVGYVILSDRNIKTEERRRQSVMSVIERKSNSTSNMIMRLSAGEEDSQTGSDVEPITNDVLKKMFGRTDVELKENFRQAMFIALNTPDIALIQGPPGTGKTTLINGIIARLGAMGNKNYKILVSSEQHEALYNVVDKLSGNSIPPFVTSEKYSRDERAENEEKMRRNIQDFQGRFLDLCNRILNERTQKDRFSDILTKLIFDVQTIVDKKYSQEIIAEKIENITRYVMTMGLWDDVKDIVAQIEAKLRNSGVSYEDEREGMDFIKRKLNSQRLDIDAFYEDDGEYQLDELQRVIKRYGYNYLLIDQALKDELFATRDESTFKKYLNYVDSIRSEIDPQKDEFELAITTYKELFDSLLNRIRQVAKYRKKDFYDIIEALKYKMSDADNVRDIIMKYTNVIGSTCAQADRSSSMIDLSGNKYDYVIIDEAARANPLDIMIPVLMGTRVIMVGDQMQLPHYVETDYVRRFKNEKEKYSNFDETLLTKSIFQVLYDSLEKSWNERKLKFRRHIRIQEQHRMHPKIGGFISEQFYERKIIDENGIERIEGGIENGQTTISKINDFNIFSGENMVWQDVPITEGMEEKSSYKLSRPAEADKVIEIVQDIVRKNSSRDYKIGIMSFYKGQVELINKLLKDKFPDEDLRKIECNTVDSYQGKEFDIVLLSTTRSNREIDIEKSLGFIHYSKSRINVALSRARRLLVVIGDAETMTRNDVFKNYVRCATKVK